MRIYWYMYIVEDLSVRRVACRPSRDASFVPPSVFCLLQGLFILRSWG